MGKSCRIFRCRAWHSSFRLLTDAAAGTLVEGASETALDHLVQPLFQLFDANFLYDVVGEGHHEQHAGLGFGYAARTHVEEGVPRRSWPVVAPWAALHVVGVDFELGLGIDVCLLGGAEVAVGLYGRGLLSSLAHENTAVEDTCGRVFEYILEEFVAGAAGPPCGR